MSKDMVTFKISVIQDKMLRSAADGESFQVFGNVSLLTMEVILQAALSYGHDIQKQGLVFQRYHIDLNMFLSKAILCVVYKVFFSSHFPFTSTSVCRL